MRSFLTPSSMPSNTDLSTPSGLSSVFSRKGGTAPNSMAFEIRSVP